MKVEFWKNICRDLALRSDGCVVGLAISMVHGKNADPSRRHNRYATLVANITDLGGVGNEVAVSNFYTLWYASSARCSIKM